jgi:hypothetical protein
VFTVLEREGTASAGGDAGRLEAEVEEKEEDEEACTDLGFSLRTNAEDG